MNPRTVPESGSFVMGILLAEYDPLAARSEQQLYTRDTWCYGDITGFNLMNVWTLKEGIGLSVNGLTVVKSRPAISTCPSTGVRERLSNTTSYWPRLKVAMSNARGYAIVPC